MAGISHVVIQFPVYEQLKLELATRRGKGVEALTPTELVVASAVAKMVASSVTYVYFFISVWAIVLTSCFLTGTRTR